MPQFLLEPLGFREDGRPFWALSGAEDDDDKGDGDDKDDDADKGDADEKDPVKKLQKALNEERQNVKAARDELRGYKVATREVGITGLDQLKEHLAKGASSAGKPAGDQQPSVDLAKITKDAETKASAKYSRELALSKVEALATKQFLDPSDVVSYFRDSADDFVGDDGKPDAKHIARELESLKVAKPHWVAPSAGTGKSTDFELGARKGATAPKSFDAELRRISALKRGGGTI